MPDIIDVIHKFSYITDKTGIEQALKVLQDQAKSLGQSIVQAQKLRAELSGLGNDADKAYRDKIVNGIAKAENAQAKYTNAIKNTIASNKQLQDEYLKETSIIGGLTIRMKELQDARFKADNVKDIEYYNKEINELAASIKNLNSLGTPRLSIAPAQPIANSNVLASRATPQAIQSVSSLGGGIVPQTATELGLIQKLNAAIADLNKRKILAGSEAEIAAINKELGVTQAQLNKVSNAGKSGGGLGRVSQSILTGLGIGTGIQLISTATNVVTDFLDKSSEFAKQVEGVEEAFNRLNRPTLLDELRVATKGTVSDLNLMKQAVQYNNLGLPIEKLGTALKFAQQRSRETGQDVNYLVKSLVDGIGRQSILKVDNLGISMKAVREEMARTGDFSTALFNIIEKGFTDSGESADSYAIRIDRLNAQLENNQARFGKYVNFLKESFIALGEDIVTLQKYQGGALQAVLDSEEARVDAAIKAQQDGVAADLRFQQNYQKFLENINTLDINSRNKRLDDAEAFYNADIAKAKSYYGASTQDFADYAHVQTIAYNKLRQILGQTPLNTRNITAQNITGATRNQLDQLASNLEAEKGDLNNQSGTDDAQRVAQINRSLALVKAQRATFDDNEKKNIAQANRQETLAEKLTKQLADLEKKKQENLLKTQVQTSETIRKEINAERDADLEKVDIDAKAATRKGEQTRQTEALFARIRQTIRDTADAEYLRKNKEFLEKLQKEQNDFDLQMAKLELDQLTQNAALPNGNTEDARRAIVEQSRTVELREAQKTFDALEQQAKELGEPLEKIEEDRQAAILLIIEQSHRKALELEAAFLKQRFDLSQKAAEQDINASNVDRLDNRNDAIVAGNNPETDRRLNIENIRGGQQANRRTQDSIFEQLDVAKTNLDKVKGYGASTKEDIAQATDEVNKLTLQLQKLQEENAKASTELAQLLGGRSLSKSGSPELFTGNLKSDIEDAIDLYGMLGQAAQNAFNQISAAKLDQINKEITYQEYAVTQAQILAERGNADALKEEQNRLTELQKQQRAAAQQQQTINAALTLSYAIAAVAKAALEGGGYASIATVAAVIAALGSGYAFVQSFSSQANTGFAKGGFTGEGGKYEPAGTVHKGEFVFDKETTSRHRELFERIHAGDYPLLAKSTPYNVLMPQPAKYSTYERKEHDTRKELRDIKEAVQGLEIEVNATQKTDINGFSQTIEKTVKRRNNSFRN